VAQCFANWALVGDLKQFQPLFVSEIALKEIIRWKQSIVDAPSGASIFYAGAQPWRCSVQLWRSTYILRVMAVHAPSAANKNSYGDGPVS
jgi:hypothetical protein